MGISTGRELLIQSEKELSGDSENELGRQSIAVGSHIKHPVASDRLQQHLIPLVDLIGTARRTLDLATYIQDFHGYAL